MGIVRAGDDSCNNAGPQGKAEAPQKEGLCLRYWKRMELRRNA